MGLHVDIRSLYDTLFIIPIVKGNTNYNIWPYMTPTVVPVQGHLFIPAPVNTNNDPHRACAPDPFHGGEGVWGWSGGGDKPPR